MKTIRTILATFGVTTLIYGIFALVAMRLNLTFTGRSIYQLFRDTGFAALVLGIGCVLSFVIMTIAIVAFRDDGGRKKRDIFDEEDEAEFLEEETVPAERAAEADETWSPEIKRKQRKALLAVDEPEADTPDLFDDSDDEEDVITIRETRKAAIAPEEPEEEPVFVEEPEEEPEPVEEPEEEPDLVEEPEPAAGSDLIEEPAEPVEEPELVEKPEEPVAPDKKRCAHCGALIDADSAFCNCFGKRV